MMMQLDPVENRFGEKVFSGTHSSGLRVTLVQKEGYSKEELLAGLTAHKLDVAVEIASLPEHIRGFEEVRENQIEQAREKQAELLAVFRLERSSL